jgi:hypothetical protein
LDRVELGSVVGQELLRNAEGREAFFSKWMVSSPSGVDMTCAPMMKREWSSNDLEHPDILPDLGEEWTHPLFVIFDLF